MNVIDELKARLFGAGEVVMDGEPGNGNTDGHAPAVVMYSTRFCPFCMRARSLLQQKGVRYREVAVDGDPDLRREMASKAGRNTVPQIWIGEAHVGGCDELMQLERDGKLDGMLAAG